MEKTIAGLDVMGKGYDVFGRFAHPSGVINQRIFQDFEDENTTYYSVDLYGDTYQVPSLLPLVEEHSTDASYVEGESVETFQENFDLKVQMDAGYTFYSAEVDFGFHQSKQTSNQYYYALYSALARGYRIALPDNETLKEKVGLDSTFEMKLNDTDNSSAAIDDLFEKYGTHFLAEGVFGGKNSYYATVEQSAISGSVTVMGTVEASYNKIFTSVDIEVDSSYYSESSVESTHSETSVETVGGDESLAPNMLTDEGQYSQWLESIKVDPALIDFTNYSLRPIWELCDTADRMEALENRYYEIVRENSATLTRGTAQNGDRIVFPWGKKEDWNLVLTPAIMGMTEGSSEEDRNNAILEYNYEIDSDFDYEDSWQVKAEYRFRTKYDDASSIEWHDDGLVNYIMIPKEIHDPITGDPKEVSVLEKVVPDSVPVTLTPPGGEEEKDNWYYLLIPYKFNYTEATDDHPDWDDDNSIIGWDWTFKQELDTYPYFWYRKGTGDNYIQSQYHPFQVLWVHKDYAYNTGASGDQALTLPPGDENLTIDDWELITSPVQIGGNTGGSMAKRTLSMMQNQIYQKDGQWHVNVTYHWCDDEWDASAVRASSMEVRTQRPIKWQPPD